MEQVAKDLGGTVKVAKINVDDNGPAAQQFGVRGIPAMFVVKGGKIQGQVRPRSANELAATLRKHTQ